MHKRLLYDDSIQKGQMFGNVRVEIGNFHDKEWIVCYLACHNHKHIAQKVEMLTPFLLSHLQRVCATSLRNFYCIKEPWPALPAGTYIYIYLIPYFPLTFSFIIFSSLIALEESNFITMSKFNSQQEAPGQFFSSFNKLAAKCCIFNLSWHNKIRFPM